jgi:DNA-binding NarL/FixJ family response regulator
LVRQGLRRLLEDEPDLEVVAEAENAARALRQIQEYRPEVVIADATLFGSTARAEQLILEESPTAGSFFYLILIRIRCGRLHPVALNMRCARHPRTSW